MPPTPNTDAYMILGYAVVFIILGATVVYLMVKQRNLATERRELEMLESESEK